MKLQSLRKPGSTEKLPPVLLFLDILTVWLTVWYEKQTLNMPDFETYLVDHFLFVIFQFNLKKILSQDYLFQDNIRYWQY